MTELASRGVTFGYEIADEENRILAEGITRHVFADTGGRPRRAPPEIIETLERFRTS
jgi:acyl-CoA thioesterase FadM